MSDKLEIDEVRKSFGNKPFTSDELYRFYLEEEPNLKEMTFRGRVHCLKVETREDISIPRIEKIMVDLFVEDQLYVTYQGGELKNIYEAFFETFSITQSKRKKIHTIISSQQG
ncbi:MAG: hypothetical protein JJE18_06440 [Eubacteriaceae bacterium]|nr:hypothetical protein [Eubacteriaceae bacterium]